MIYLFLGQDIITPDGLSKKYTALNQIKKQFLEPAIEAFNLDILYSKGLSLKDLQERFLSLPIKAKRRVIVIREAQNLKEDTKEFILNYVKKPLAALVLVLDIEHQEPRDTFVRSISNYARVWRFRETIVVDTFTLSRAIQAGKPDYALMVLNQLLVNGERPEMILGGLRYACERDIRYPIETKKKLKCMLNCDIEIKTGRLKPAFALERLMLRLCSLGKPFG